MYSRQDCQSSAKASLWFEEYGIKVEKKNLKQLSRNDLVYLLSLTDRGMKEILKYKNKSQATFVSEFLTSDCKFEEAVDFLISHAEMFRSPIILDKGKYLIGYNQEEIRKFLSADYRKIEIP